MRFLSALLLTTMLGPLVAAQPFSGTYSGSISGTPATLTLHQEGSSLRGTVDAGGYGYVLTGVLANGTASGTLSDPQTGGTMPCEVTMQGSTLTLTILAPNAQGQVQRMPLTFSRGGEPQGRAPAQPSQSQASEPLGERDPALIGLWSYSDTYMSGEFSATTRLSLQINPDGTYLYGDGDVTMGGSDYSGRSSGGDVTRGEWRTQGDILYARDPSSPQWSPHARYYVEGNRMLFTFGDGSRQVWYRR